MENTVSEMLDNISKSFNDYYHSKCSFKNFEDNKILEDYVKMKILETCISEVRTLKDLLPKHEVQQVIGGVNLFDMREQELFDALQEIEKEVLGSEA